MHFTLISPRIAVQKGDFLGSGVPYWPLDLAILAAFLRERGDSVRVIDLFGAASGQLTDSGDHYLQGGSIEDFLRTPAIQDAEIFILYALSYMSHGELLRLARRLKDVRPEAVIAVLENSQAVTGYSIQRMAAGFFSAGVDALFCGDPYFNWEEIAAWLKDPSQAAAPDNVIPLGSPADRPVRRRLKKRASYPVPAWDLFNLEGYWSLPYAHGPKTGRYLPILASRGCPYPCDFCVAPETNNQRWRERAPEEVVDEMITLRDRFGVRHFHVEDLNPTVKATRWKEISNLLLERNAGVYFYFVSGTKAETVPVQQVPLLAKAGCRYLSISPESGSAEVMKVIGKRFNYDHGLELVRACREHGIRTQACFLVGHPAETTADHARSCEYLRRLVRADLDEVAVFILAPFAGSALSASEAIPVERQSALPSFSPAGRKDYALLARRRRELIRVFFAEKLKKGWDLWLQGFRSIIGRPQTKMENLPRRALFILMRVPRARRRAGAEGSH